MVFNRRMPGSAIPAEHNRNPMQTLLDCAVFTSGGRTYRWEDVFLSASLLGDWAGLENKTRDGIARLARAIETAAAPSAEQIERAAEEFRYARNLITAEEAEAWLARWDITIDGWFDYLRRRLLRHQEQDGAQDPVSGHQVTAEEIAECLVPEGVCSGAFFQWARALATRAAAYEALRSGAGAVSPDDAADPSTVFPHFGKARSSVLPESISRPPHDKLELLARLEMSLHRFRDEIVSSCDVDAEIAQRRLDWIRLYCELALFPDEQVAREAILCLRDDHQTLGDIAARARTTAREIFLCLEDVETGWRSTLLAASPGEVLGPLRMGEHVAVLAVRDKLIPTSQDPEIQQRAQRAAFDRAVERAVQAHIKWQISFGDRAAG